MKLQIRYGSELHELCLTEKWNRHRVQDILEQIEKHLKVPICHQSLTFKGQRLDQIPNTNLDDLYLFNNSKLVLTGTQTQFHNKYCCPDHEHADANLSSQEENARGDGSKQQELPPGFQPEPNKHYEYYTVPYKTDEETLFQTIPPSTSNVH